MEHSQALQWRTSSYSDGMQCVQIADLGDGTIGVRDSKDPDGPTLRFTRAEMNAFANGVKGHEFDDLLP